MVDPRTPVIVGVGQVNQRAAPEDARSPVGLFVDAARLADADAGGRVLRAVDTVAVVQIGSWGYTDPGALAARELRIEPRSTVVSTVGGNSPQLLANGLGAAIVRGERDVVLLGGGEVLHARRRARKAGGELHFEVTDDEPCREVVGDLRPGTNEIENAHGAIAPITMYPLLETALRGAAGRSIEEHQRHVGALWSTFSHVAATNPHAWSRTAYTPDEIVEVTPDNRMVTFPYTKRMSSNIDVDQGAALLLCSLEAARRLGVADDRIVFLHSGADASDHWFVSERWSLARSVAIGAVVRAALAATNLGIDDVARFDLYSCFPSAVELALESIGLAGPLGGDPRPLTVTGGLGFAGGPLNNYPTHAIATMVEQLRADPGSCAVTTALGWYATKHSCGVWSTTPPVSAFTHVDPATTQGAVDALPRREPATTYEGPVTIEATSVPFDRDGTPVSGIVMALADDGRRVVANVHDTGALVDMTKEAWEGRRARVATDGSVNIVEAVD
jgi:acetyl-CoA C-acetyltransferase